MVFKFSNLDILKEFLNFKYTANTSDTDQDLLYSNDNVDTDITVKFKSPFDSTTNTTH